MNIRKLTSSLLASLLLVFSVSQIASAADSLATVTGFEVEKTEDTAITLKWNAVPNATGYTILYGTESVEGDDEDYNRPAIDLDNVTTHKVTELTKGTTYYFTIFAFNNTSTSEFVAEEIHATAQAEAAVGAANNANNAIISAVTVIDNTTVDVVFSVEMDFPANVSSEIRIIKGFDETPLTIKKAEVKDSKTLRLTTDKHSEGAEYRLTITDKIVDKVGNPLPENERRDIFVGGSDDSFANLLGAADSNAGDLKILSALIGPAADENGGNGIELTFNKAVVLDENPVKQFAIVETNSPSSASLNIRDVLQNSSDPAKVLLVTEELKSVTYTVIALRVKDADGKLIAEANSMIEIKGGELQLGEDTNAGDSTSEVSSLKATFTDIAKLLAKLTWGVDNLDTGIQEFKVYLQTNGTGEYALLAELNNASLTEFTTDDSLPEAELYKFKVTTVDADGNESEGSIAELVLPGTGPVGLLMLAAGSLGAGRLLTRRKNN